MILEVNQDACMHDIPIHSERTHRLWQALEEHYLRLKSTPLSELFVTTPARAAQFSVALPGLFLDYSKQSFDESALASMLELTEACGLEKQRAAMFHGEVINRTEHRTVLHTALRKPDGDPLIVDGVNVRALVKNELQRMQVFANGIRQGTIKANDGGAFTQIVNIGIGGSDLGPKMAIEALTTYLKEDLCFHFLSNPDTPALHAVFSQIDPERTLVLVSSKTFTTQDTLANFKHIVGFLSQRLGSHAAALRHCVALTASPERALQYGFAPECIFRFWDWVGGRYSMWSAIGLPIMIAIGPALFDAFLEGGHEMDQHFLTAPLKENMPVMLALTGIWNHSIAKDRSVMLAIYDSRLQFFTPYVQQLDMESNGKRVDHSGQPLTRPSSPIVWGGLGINGQHAYFQLVHQGTQRVPVEFIGVLKAPQQNLEHQRIVFSNLLAQTEALMMGRSRDQIKAEMLDNGMREDQAEALADHRSFPGNIPSTTLLVDDLTPKTLGALVALYEHKIFVQGVIWGVNSFDQWGVELGKVLSRAIYDELNSTPRNDEHDPSTQALIARVFNALH